MHTSTAASNIPCRRSFAQVFLSYRVAADVDLAEMVYTQLTMKVGAGATAGTGDSTGGVMVGED